MFFFFFFHFMRAAPFSLHRNSVLSHNQRCVASIWVNFHIYTKDKLIAFHLNWIAFLIFRRGNYHYSYSYCFSFFSIFFKVKSENAACSKMKCIVRCACSSHHSSIQSFILKSFDFCFPISNKFQPTLTQILQNIYLFYGFLQLLAVSNVGFKTQFHPVGARRRNTYNIFQVWNDGSSAIWKQKQAAL